MAKIENTTVYPLVTPNASDFVIGTDTSDDNRTVSFSISDITASGGLQDLQSVLTTGGTATENINLTGNITVVGTVYPTTITAAGTPGAAGQILSSTGTGIQWVDTSVIASNTLQEVTTAGNTTTDDIVMSGGDINSTGSIVMNGAAQSLALSNGVDIGLGVGSDIVTFGNINLVGGASVLNLGSTAAINDYSGATGTAGQVLTVNGAGTGVEWSTGIPSASMPTLQEVLTAGNTATGIGISFSGVASGSTYSVSSPISSLAPNIWQGTNSFTANGTTISTAGIALSGSLWDGAATGTSGQVLTSTVTGVSWADLSTIGVSSVNASTPVAASSPATPITISPNTGGVLIRQNIYTGGSNIGCVPDLGTASTFLRGDGTWVTPSGDVASVSAAASATSTGAPLIITPTSGAVVVTPQSYAGTTNVGHVPTGGSASTFLRGDGTWVTPSGGSAPEWVSPALLGIAKFTLVPGTFYVGGPYAATYVPGNRVFHDNLSSAPSVGGMTDDQHTLSLMYANGPLTGCVSSYPNHTLCDVTILISVTNSDTYEITLWKSSLSTSATYTQAAIWTEALTAGTLNATQTFTVSGGGVEVLAPGEGLFATLRCTTGGVTSGVNAQLSLKFTGSI